MIITVEEYSNYYIVQFTKIGEKPIRKYASTQCKVDHLIRQYG